MNHDNINTLAIEAPTPGYWQTVVSDKPDDTSASIMVIKPEAAHKAHELLEVEDMVYVAHFARPADLRRVMACLKQFQRIPTDAIETMPTDVHDLIGARLYLTDLLRKTTEAAAGAEEEWAAVREHMRAIHEANAETERQRARPN